jgi:hypothetical protein
MVSIKEATELLAQNFTLNEAIGVAKPMLLFILGLAIYSLFIFKFYKFVAKRDVFNINFKEYNQQNYSRLKKSFHGIGYLIKYILIFPLLTFFWLIILTTILAFLSKQSTVNTILLVSVSLVGVVRVMSYYNEDLSKDLSKMLPFALLGVFLVDVSYFSISTSLEAIKNIPALWKIIIYYLLVIILLEFILRVLYIINRMIFQKDSEK